MKTICSVFALIIFSVGISNAATEVITFPAKKGDVTFNHKLHQDMIKNCKACHVKTPGKIEGFDKNAAHKMCIGCHKTKNAGPVTCKECHKKK